MSKNHCTSAGLRAGHLSRAAHCASGSTIDHKPITFSFSSAQPRTKAPPPSTSPCMVCMIRREIRAAPKKGHRWQELTRRGWDPEELKARRKGDKHKVAIAVRLRRETTM